MKVKIKEKLNFIHCDSLLAFDINVVNGIYVLTAGKFKQNLKKSEYDKIMKISVIDKKETAKDKKAREKEELAIKDKEEADKKAKKDAEKSVDDVSGSDEEMPSHDHKEFVNQGNDNQVSGDNIPV